MFNCELNIEFHYPKKDGCDACEAMQMNAQPTDERKTTLCAHLKGNLETKIERDKDRMDKESYTVCFKM